MGGVRVIVGDCRSVLRDLPDESVNCVVTSPPYFGLRDYGVDGQIGLEASVSDHIAALRDVFREIRRILLKDGTLWVNYGDGYASTPNGNTHLTHDGRYKSKRDDRTFTDKPLDTIKASGLKPKDLMGLPWRLAFAMQEDGWWLRSDIIWAKPNPMPESIKDRPTKSHEYLFLLAKSDRYFFDAEAIAEPSIHAGQLVRTNGNEGMDAGYDGHRTRDGLRRGVVVPETRHPRSVWNIATAPFPEAHFATFPPELAERCIKAGCPEGGVVLDPFFGAGTTGLVADRLRRSCIGIELNPAYAEIARRRIAKDAGMFAEVQSA